MIDIKLLPIDMAQYWPPYLQNKQEMLALAHAVKVELQKFQNEVDRVYKNQYVMTADEEGLARFEALPNINIKPRNDATLEDRRMAILAKMQTRLPYTKRMLNQLLKALLGEGMYTLTISTKDYLVTVIVELKRKNQIQAVADLLRRVIPVNMDYLIQVRYNQYYMLTTLTYAQLKEYLRSFKRFDRYLYDAYERYAPYYSFADICFLKGDEVLVSCLTHEGYFDVADSVKAVFDRLEAARE